MNDFAIIFSSTLPATLPLSEEPACLRHARNADRGFESLVNYLYNWFPLRFCSLLCRLIKPDPASLIWSTVFPNVPLFTFDSSLPPFPRTIDLLSLFFFFQQPWSSKDSGARLSITPERSNFFGLIIVATFERDARKYFSPHGRGTITVTITRIANCDARNQSSTKIIIIIITTNVCINCSNDQFSRDFEIDTFLARLRMENERKVGLFEKKRKRKREERKYPSTYPSVYLENYAIREKFDIGES